MEIMFIALISLGLGAVVALLVPGRNRLGSGLLPGVAAAAGSLSWAGLTWLGLAWNGGVIWWLSLLGAALAALIVGIVLVRRRTSADADLARAATTLAR